MPITIQCARVNHPNIVVEDFDASIRHFREVYGAQFVLDMPRPEWHAGLMVIGGVLFEVFAPYEFLLNARYGPHHLGIEYQADIDQARAAIAERGIRVMRDIGPAVHTHPADGFGVSFEFYSGNFHDEPQPNWSEQMHRAEYWSDEHPLGLTGLARYSIAVADLDAAGELVQGFLGGEPIYEEPRPAIAGHARGFALAGSTVELMTPVGDGELQRHLYRYGDGIRSTVFGVRDAAQVRRYFDERGLELHPGDAPGTLAVPPEANRGILFEFTE